MIRTALCNPPFQYGGSQNAFAFEPNSINPLGRVRHVGVTKQF